VVPFVARVFVDEKVAPRHGGHRQSFVRSSDRSS
jgi:hypothetical protein